MGTTAIAPAPQHMQALAQANRVRLARAELKRLVAEGEANVAEVVLECPWQAESMTIADLLMSQHRWGRSRCRRFLLSIPMTETKTIGSMTERQRKELASRLSGEHARCVGVSAADVYGVGESGPLSGRPAGAEARPARGDLDDVTVGIADVDRLERAAVEHLGARHAALAQVVAPRLLLVARSPRAARSGAWCRCRPRPRACDAYSMKVTNVPSPASNQTWRASGSSSDGSSRTSVSPSTSR